jgi:hypothetical protein
VNVYCNTECILVPSSELSHSQRARSDGSEPIKMCAKNNFRSQIYSPFRPEREADGLRPSVDGFTAALASTAVSE